jgi:large subunit ribosomal protein L10
MRHPDGRRTVRFLLRGGEAVPNASNVAEVQAIKGRLEGSVAALLTEYRGLKVAELGELRASLRGSSTEYRVLKNTLTSIAVREAGYEDLVGLLQGPTAVAFVHGDPVQAAKDLAEFARTHPSLVVKGGVMDGKVLGADEVRRLATLESREVLLARLAGLLQASAQQTVNLLAAPLRQVATMTAALRDQRAEAEPQGGDAAAGHSDQRAEAEPQGGTEAETTDTPAAGSNDTPAGPAETQS